MQRKHNPFVALVGLILLALLLATTAGCAAPAEPADRTENTRTETTETATAAAEAEATPLHRFTTDRFYAPGAWETCICYVITDNETGVQYLACSIGQGIGLTVLQDGEG